ncbi:hypothetical protein BGZ65_011514 [Modicella reniformis]|uniref:Cytochrome P450 n=1 Tax=Modicella reniformis TaxID=1440133 RepID=A0A9P6MBX4_9FUNG|nr:hypothetical protein BGZ65_011514 [Modicella reniformis]
MTLLTVIEKTSQHSMVSLTVTLSALLTYGLYKSWFYPLYLDPLTRVDGPAPSRIPLLGNILALAKKKPMMAMYDWAMQYPGSIYRYYWFGRLTLLTSDPVTVGYVLGKSNDNWLKCKATEDQFEQSLGHSLLSMNVAEELIDVWLKRIPVKGQSEAITRETRWEFDGKTYTTFDLESSFYCLTMDSIGQFALGQGFDAIKSPISPDFENYRIIAESFKVTLLSLLPFSDWIPTETNRRAWNAVREFNQSMANIVQKRKQEILKEVEANGGTFSQDEGASSQKKDMLTMLMVDQLSGEGGSDKQIQDDVFTAIFAGHETTLTALSWTFYELARHPEVQTRLREETRQLYKDTNGIPSYDALNSLPYLNAVIREGLRLWSPVPLNLRVNIEDDYLPRNNGLEPLFVSAGTYLHIPIFILQRDPKIWGPDALTFNPDRWISGGPCPPYMPPTGVCYFPFYHGKRSCIGSKIAILEMKIHIANLVNMFEFVQTPEMRANQGEIDWRWSISLKPTPGVRLGVRLAD